jgi:acetyltransferase-like isoleucine patch superfamily enzyme
MAAETPSALVTRLLFDYEAMPREVLQESVRDLPRKLVRWLAIHHPDNRTRLIFFEATGVQIGEGTVINAGLTIYDEYEPRVRFGKRVAVATGVTLVASSNPNNSELQRIPYVQERLIRLDRIEIGDDAWLGTGAIVIGVDVGEGAIVGAGAVVTRPVPPYSVVAGNPARVIRSLR